LIDRIRNLKGDLDEKAVTSKRSICFDYFLTDQTKIYLVELKTDQKSFNKKQYDYYRTIKNSEYGTKYLYTDYKKFFQYGYQKTDYFENFGEKNDKLRGKKLVLRGILEQKYHDKEVKLLEDINEFKGNERKYLWQLYKILLTSGKHKLIDVFYRENDLNSKVFKDLEIVYILPYVNESIFKSEIDYIILLEEIVNKKIEFNKREVGYLKRTACEFDAAWEDFQKIWKALVIKH
jgi:hypothetical protein